VLRDEVCLLLFEILRLGEVRILEVGSFEMSPE
jgi:hypothetical protein